MHSLCGTRAVGRRVDRVGEAEQRDRERAFLRFGDRRRTRRRPQPVSMLGAPEHRLDARVRVLQVRAGVAVEREHAVEVERVVLDPFARQVGVLHRADADGARDRRACVAVEIRVLLVDDRVRPFAPPRRACSDSFGVSPDRDLSGRAVRAEHRAEVRRARRAPAAPASPPSARRGTPGVRCWCWRLSTTYSRRVPSQVAHAVPDRRHVGGAVAEAAVGLSDDERRFESVDEDAERAVVDHRDAVALRVRRPCRRAGRCRRSPASRRRRRAARRAGCRSRRCARARCRRSAATPHASRRRRTGARRCGPGRASANVVVAVEQRVRPSCRTR